jgi:hypothetical protein
MDRRGAGDIMIVDTPEGRYAVRWSYTYDSAGRNVTACRIVKEDDSWRPLVGRTVCSVKDMFSREVGRKISMGRALSRLSREKRRPFWLAYFSRSPKYQDMARNVRETISIRGLVATCRMLCTRTQKSNADLGGTVDNIS